jgi:uncharacterized membrane protein YdjX (TVP38/TMEM64 family)
MRKRPRRGSPFIAARRAVRPLVLILLAAGIFAAWDWRSALDPVAISTVVGQHPAAPLAFLGLHVAASLLFLPRTVLAVAAGLVFGMTWGVIWAAMGSVLGAVAGFCIARHVASGLVDRGCRAKAGSVLDGIERGGWRSIALLRLVPVIPHSLSNYALGLTPVRLGPYAFGSLVGQLPITIACVDLGAAGERAALGDAGWIVPSLIGAAVLTLSLLIPAAARRRIE